MRLEHACDSFRLERVDRIQRLGRRRRCELDELGCAVEAHQRVREVVRCTGRRRGECVRLELPPWREQDVDEGGSDRREDVEQRSREPAADPARLHEHRREEDDERLHEHVASLDVRQLVCDRGLELLAAQ